jgi:hypothetical protein
MSSIDDLPSIQTKSIEPSKASRVLKGIRTIHNELHVAYKTMDDLKRLGSGHPSLIKGKAV